MIYMKLTNIFLNLKFILLFIQPIKILNLNPKSIIIPDIFTFS